MVVDEAAEVERWVTVSEAAELSGISGATIRQWYRSGRIPTQRAKGDRGAFLVPLSAILRFSEEADAAGDDLGDPVLDLNASYWSLETAAAREEAAIASSELDEARQQLTFLREQLAEASAAERAAAKRADDLEAELAILRRISAATASITDTSWLELPTNRYESPVRNQGMASEPAPTQTQARPTEDACAADDLMDLDAVEEVDATEPVAEHFRPGEHADDLLPAAERKGRRGRR